MCLYLFVISKFEKLEHQFFLQHFICWIQGKILLWDNYTWFQEVEEYFICINKREKKTVDEYVTFSQIILIWGIQQHIFNSLSMIVINKKHHRNFIFLPSLDCPFKYIIKIVVRDRGPWFCKWLWFFEIWIIQIL